MQHRPWADRQRWHDHPQQRFRDGVLHFLGDVEPK
jgi:hypothetical protein